jgi:hypothetical protein
MSNEAVELELLNPRGEIEPAKTFALAPRVSDLAGKRIGFYWNGKPGIDNFFSVLEENLKKMFPDVTTTLFRGPMEITDKDIQGWASQIDTFVYAVGD